MTNSASEPGDLNSNRIRTKVRTVLNELANVYERAKVPADFWDHYDREERSLTERVGKRPITLMEIESACMNFRSKLLRLLK
jgi:hypothetical protein